MKLQIDFELLAEHWWQAYCYKICNYVYKYVWNADKDFANCAGADFEPEFRRYLVGKTIRARWAFTNLSMQILGGKSNSGDRDRTSMRKNVSILK